jgi:16S rRNA (adenine1518-N6/adenine1519-N6)-dimethyltransferase
VTTGRGPAPSRPPWSELRARLEGLGFRPSKTLGQNFLVDPNTVRSIARDSRVAADDVVLEVGAGCGFLSVELAALGVQLLAVEIDPRLQQVAGEALAPFPRASLVAGDVLAGKHTLAPRVAELLPASGPWHLVANLPYSVSAPLLVVLSRWDNPPASMTVLVQEEVARRVAAEPGGAEWGALSARLGLVYRARLGRAVGPQLFWPRPRVASRVVHLERREESVPGAERAAYDLLAEHLFQARRKQVGGILRRWLGDGPADELLDRCGLAPEIRPEALAPAQLRALAARLDPGLLGAQGEE